MSAHLLLCDFDDTMFDTSTPSPNGVDVHTASKWAIAQIFGKEGVDIFDKEGGLRSRAPSELVQHLLTQRNAALLENARRYFASQEANPSLWDETHPDQIITELFVKTKLSKLISEISREWPKPCKGFLEFWEMLHSLKKDGLQLDLGIISSGHDLFIHKVLEIWNLQFDFVITEDQVRATPLPTEISLRVKPGPLPMLLALHEWANYPGKFLGLGEQLIYAPVLDQILFVGDDAIKDMELAKNMGAVGIHFSKGDEPLCIEQDGWLIKMNNWRDLGLFLCEHVQQLHEGMHLNHLFAESSVFLHPQGPER